jgi:hypothetical protein
MRLRGLFAGFCGDVAVNRLWAFPSNCLSSVIQGSHFLDLKVDRYFGEPHLRDLFLYSFQGQRTGRARQGLCPNQMAMICPISKRSHRHPSLNSPPSSRLVSPSCRAYPAGNGKASICRSMLPNRHHVRWLASRAKELSRQERKKSKQVQHDVVLHADCRARCACHLFDLKVDRYFGEAQRLLGPSC